MQERITRTYTIVCLSCNGAGYIDNPGRVSSSPTIVCPVCNGSRITTVSEEYPLLYKKASNISERGRDGNNV